MTFYLRARSVWAELLKQWREEEEEEQRNMTKEKKQNTESAAVIWPFAELQSHAGGHKTLLYSSVFIFHHILMPVNQLPPCDTDGQITNIVVKL